MIVLNHSNLVLLLQILSKLHRLRQDQLHRLENLHLSRTELHQILSCLASHVLQHPDLCHCSDWWGVLPDDALDGSCQSGRCMVFRCLQFVLSLGLGGILVRVSGVGMIVKGLIVNDLSD